MSTKFNGSNYSYVSQTIQLNTSHLFTQLDVNTVLFQTLQFSLNTFFSLHAVKSKTVYFNYSTQFHLSQKYIFVYTQLYMKTFPIQTIQFSERTDFNCQTVLFDA